MMSSFRVWLLLALFRLFSVYLVVSWFVPDEIYQSTEVAHRLVFGVGHISWEWTYGLRSYLHPAIIAVFFKLLQFFDFDYRFLVYQLPRIIHALLFSLGDISYYRLCYRLSKTSRIALFSFASYLTCWFVFYCGPRTLSNSLETSLTLIALTWFPFEGAHEHAYTIPYIVIGLVTIIIRPTVALIWIVFGIHHLTYCWSKLYVVFALVVPTTITVIGTCVVFESLALGELNLPLWNFLSFNVLKGGSAMFGVHPWYWYFTEGLPSVLSVQFFLAVFALIGLHPLLPSYLPFCASAVYVVFHSFLPHKEQRFLLPIIPFLCLYTGVAIDKIRVSFGRAKLFPLLFTMFFINAIIALVASRYHQVGPFQASHAVITQAAESGKSFSIAALMPCYSLPGHSYFHHDVNKLRMLDCSPDISGKRAGKPDEADTFYANHQQWLEDVFENEHQQYDRILMYEKTYLRVADWFTRRGWIDCHRAFHSYILTSSREDHYIKHSCNGTIVEHPEFGEVIQLTGDQRDKVKDFLIKVGIVKEENCRVHGF
ncbi:unnamed protein product [Caenorhabditis auriculariae]|uniref:Mannosyltransferase n=1 Tax=Caenorhabditis auriculariae TaxID=2777116 RepID=A0A8S1H436_9PELO|nr:unnamed protein product [Caenorhabditis auriculariae]